MLHDALGRAKRASRSEYCHPAFVAFHAHATTGRPHADSASRPLRLGAHLVRRIPAMKGNPEGITASQADRARWLAARTAAAGLDDME